MHGSHVPSCQLLVYHHVVVQLCAGSAGLERLMTRTGCCSVAAAILVAVCDSRCTIIIGLQAGLLCYMLVHNILASCIMAG
jgi:hypothetical protein